MYRLHSSIALVLLVMGLAAQPAAAQSEAEVNQIIRQLAPIAGQTVPAAPGTALTAPAPTVATPTTPRDMLVEVIISERVLLIDPTHAMDFRVHFGFDSVELTPQARADLRALGRALVSSDLRPYRYLIAGHTDASGEARYNQRLSERRAAAVRRYLIETFPIHASRLVAVGFGEDRLKDAANPRAAINRRVEVAMIVPQ